MKKRITKMSIHQTSKFMAVLYGFIGVVILPFALLAGIFTKQIGIALGGLLAPILYGLIGYVASAIGCFIYNLAAKISGGVEFELSDEA